MYTVLLFAVGLVIFVTASMILIRLLMGPDPPPEPPPAIHEEPDREALFRPLAWRKRTRGVPRPPGEFNRPLEIGTEEDEGVLPPPRQIRGVNQE